MWLGLAHGNSQIIRMISDLRLGETHTGNHASHNSGVDPFLCIESSSQNGNWTLPLLGNWENQPRCKLYRWISHAKSVVAKPKDQHSRSVGIRIGIACVSEGHFRMTYFFLFCFHVCRLVLPNLGSVLSHQPFLQPGSLGHHLPFVFLHVVLRSHQSGSSWRRAKCYLTHTLDSLVLTTLEARHPQAVYDLNSDLPCVRETRQLYRTSLLLEWSYSFMWFKKKIEMTFN